MDESEWGSRLQAAADALNRSPDAPDWLKGALRDAVAVAPDLAPAQKAGPKPPEFFYPH